MGCSSQPGGRGVGWEMLFWSWLGAVGVGVESVLGGVSGPS